MATISWCYKEWFILNKVEAIVCNFLSEDSPTFLPLKIWAHLESVQSLLNKAVHTTWLVFVEVTQQGVRTHCSAWQNQTCLKFFFFFFCCSEGVESWVLNMVKWDNIPLSLASPVQVQIRLKSGKVSPEFRWSSSSPNTHANEINQKWNKATMATMDFSFTVVSLWHCYYWNDLCSLFDTLAATSI